jgi:cytochrome c oxidase assembly factor CtaG
VEPHSRAIRAARVWSRPALHLCHGATQRWPRCLLALSEVPWFPLYIDRARGVTDPLVDQQLGGFLMWVPSGIVMTVFGLALFAAWLGEGERRRKKGWSS